MGHTFRCPAAQCSPGDGLNGSGLRPLPYLHTGALDTGRHPIESEFVRLLIITPERNGVVLAPNYENSNFDANDAGVVGRWRSKAVDGIPIDQFSLFL